MTESKVAVRYAKSLLGLAQEQGVLDAVNQDMQLLLKTVHDSREMNTFLHNPTIKTDKKIAVLNQLFGSKINKLSMAFLKLITTKKRESNLTAIAMQFSKQYKAFKGIETAVITSAVGLDDTLRRQVIDLVKESSRHEQVELVEEIDKKLIGGFILRIDDRQVDASVLRNLRKLNRELHSNITARLN